jgi:predicted RecB family nuclease
MSSVITCVVGLAIVAQHLLVKKTIAIPPFSIDSHTEALETGNPTLIKRILAYNHDDCRAPVALRKAVP